MMKICFATNNKHKLDEVRNVVASKHIRILSLQDINCYEELPETSDTLEGNSLQKAAYVFEKYKVPCFADDTGLEVDALNGAPGVYSARYAGEHKNSDDNITLLLDELKQEKNQSAKFRTIITLVGLEKETVSFEGIIKGNIIAERRGSSGFGYDSVFIPHGHSRTFAEMTQDEKNKLSHRAIAVRQLEMHLKNLLHQK